ncbi:MAG: DMT family transporter [Gammaproteobacteria bacterium]|nr:DMT family transporter [Gammaproteobacteria bacterium]MDH3466321.1 DMT family transporter [Gammaproteobacteria bacterium]
MALLPRHDSRLPHSVIGALLMVATWQIVPFMDTIAKHLSSSYPILQIVYARFFFHFAVVFPVVVWRHGAGAVRTDKAGLQILRGGFLLMATLLFFTSISYIPLANAVALVFIAPVILTAMSALLLREKVPATQWIAVSVGFIAVLIIVRPGFTSFHWASLLALCTAVAFSRYLLSTRMLAGTAPPLVTLMYESLLGVIATSATLPFVRVAPAAMVWLLMVTLGVIAAVSHFLVIKAFEFADASALAPYNYTEIVMATALGYFVFGDFPDPWTWVGMAPIEATAV